MASIFVEPYLEQKTQDRESVWMLLSFIDGFAFGVHVYDVQLWIKEQKDQ